MPLDSAERLYLDRQVTLARAILVALALVDLLEMSPAPARARPPPIFLAVYLLVALAIWLYERLSSEMNFSIPLVADFVALAVFLFLTPSISAWWFLFLFVVFALATQGSSRAMLGFVSVAAVGMILRLAASDSFGWHGVGHWLSIGLGTVISGLGMGFLGAREREHLERRQFLEKITRLLQFDRGLTESVRQALGEIALAFQCEQACLAIRDEELERLFVWKIHPNQHEPGGPETLPLSPFRHVSDRRLRGVAFVGSSGTATAPATVLAGTAAAGSLSANFTRRPIPRAKSSACVRCLR